MAQRWTVARVKAELPDVMVYGVWGQHIRARVRGRRLKQARVQWHIGSAYFNCEFPWQTITDALNTGRELRA